MEKVITAILLGMGLSAACGFRVFVPFLFVSIASRAGYITLAGGWEWIGSVTSIVVFATATALEIGAYYIPWLDNLLDSIAAPAAIVGTDQPHVGQVRREEVEVGRGARQPGEAEDRLAAALVAVGQPGAVGSGEMLEGHVEARSGIGVRSVRM